MRNMSSIHVLKAICLLPVLSVLLLENAQAVVSQSAFTDAYQPVPPVSAGQSQVVYYRQGNAGDKAPAANVYVDGEFHSGLLPGGYTVFCIAPGSHGVDAVQNDAPEYARKQHRPLIDFDGGETLFLRVDEARGEGLLQIPREKAEKELVGNLRQTHVVSRASAVKSCSYDKLDIPYTLSSEVLFGFGKSSYNDVDVEARKSIAMLARRLHAESDGALSISVIGHTDRIGNESANYALGLKRAETVRQLLIDNGFDPVSVSASSMGGSSPVVESCQGGREQLIKCFAPNRRVVLHVKDKGI